MTPLSVVIASRNEGERLAGTVGALLDDLPPDGEIVVVDDASSDGSADRVALADRRVRVHRCAVRHGAAGARNLGARLARGGVLLFCDAHVEPRTAWSGTLLAALDDPRVGAVGVTLENWDGAGLGYGLRLVDVSTDVEWLDRRGRRPYRVPLLGGFFLAARRAVLRRVGGFDQGMRGWGIEDIELCVRLWSLGWDCVLLPDVVVRHYDKHDDRPDYQLDWAQGLTNIIRFGAIHYGAPRWDRLLERYAGDPALPRAVTSAAGAADRRRIMHAVRARGDDEFFALCGIW
jgi:GT2 family glycosyltransferase